MPVKNTTRKNSYKNSYKNNYSKFTKTPEKFEQKIVLTFLQMLNTVKLYHWKTHSYATHKATDELYSALNGSIDSFVEILLGKYGNRVNLSRVKSIPLKDFVSDDQFKREIMYFKEFLVGLDTNNAMHLMSNSDLYNIRDEMLGQFNQLLYLLTFK